MWQGRRRRGVIVMVAGRLRRVLRDRGPVIQDMRFQRGGTRVLRVEVLVARVWNRDRVGYPAADRLAHLLAARASSRFPQPRFHRERETGLTSVAGKARDVWPSSNTGVQ